MKVIDRGLACLLILGALLHIMGSWMGYRHAPEMLLWSLAASLATLLVAALNLLRVGRPHDRPLAWVCLGGCLGHIAIALGYGAISGNVLDLRVLINTLAAAVLAVFSLRSAVGAGEAAPAQR